MMTHLVFALSILFSSFSTESKICLDEHLFSEKTRTTSKHPFSQVSLFLNTPILLSELKDQESLRHRWSLLAIQGILNHHLSPHLSQKFFFSADAARLMGSCPLDQSQKVHDFFEQLQKEGISEEECKTVKLYLLDHSKKLEEMKTVGLYQEALSQLINNSQQAIEEISCEDLSSLLRNCSLKIVKNLFSHKLKASTVAASSQDSEALFGEIALADWEKKTIYKIVTTIAVKNPIKLAFEKKSLDKKGKRINHVHPFWFIGYICKDRRLKECLRDIRKSHFKWQAFVDGFSRRMKEESSKDNLDRYIPGFALYLQVNPDEVKNYIYRRDWEGLIRYLL